MNPLVSKWQTLQSLTERGDFVAAEIAYWQILHNRTYPVNDQCDACNEASAGSHK